LSVSYRRLISLDFDEKRFDLDEYEQRLTKFEDYLNKRKQSVATEEEEIKEEPKPEDDGFAEVVELFKTYCEKFRPLDSRPKNHVSY